MDEGAVTKILVVDDRPENLLAMEKLLKKLGASIHKASSGEKALQEVVSHRFAVILLDVQMPDMDGFEVATLLRSNKQTANIPIIFVTAINKDQVYVSKGYQVGAVDYLSKPIKPEILISKVTVFLQLEEQRQALETVTKELRRMNTKNELLLACADEGILGVNSEGVITFINPAACHYLGASEADLSGKHVSQFLLAGGKKSALAAWHDSDLKELSLIQGETVRRSGLIWKHEGDHFPSDYSFAALTDERNKVTGAVLLFRDITTRKQLEDNLIKMAKYDSLTGLANRVLFKEFIVASIARSERRKKNTVVMFLDLDHFKAVNDTLGHDAGDKLLISVAKRLKTCVREGDMIARLGGDEFAVILDDVAQPQDATIVADKIIKVIKEPCVLEGEECFVGTSIGIASYPESGPEAEDVIKAADQAMYAVKKDGRNGYRFYSELRQPKGKRFEQVKPVESVQQKVGLRKK